MDIIPDFADRKLPDNDCKSFKQILNGIADAHCTGPLQYTMADSARKAYAQFYDELAARARKARDADLDDIKGAIMKAQVCDIFIVGLCCLSNNG